MTKRREAVLLRFANQLLTFSRFDGARFLQLNRYCKSGTYSMESDHFRLRLNLK